MPDDRDLLAAWAGGDDSGGSEFYRPDAERVTRFFSRKLADNVADLVQRTFLKILEAEKKGTEITSVAGFLFAIARTELFDELRRKQKNRNFEPEITSLEDLATGASQLLAIRGAAM